MLGAFGTLGALALFACDSAGNFAECYDGDAAAPGPSERCRDSRFAKDDERLREYELNGRVMRGESPVRGAVVRMEPTEGFLATVDAGASTGTTFPPFATVTNEAGGFRVPQAAPTYDLWARADNEVAVHRNLLTRYIEIPFEDGLADGWPTHIDVPVVTPLAAAHTLAFLVSGIDALALRGDLDAGLEVRTRAFNSIVRIVALEYPAGGTIAAATRYSATEVRVTSGQRAVAEVNLLPLGAIEVEFAPVVPDGYTLSPIELSVDLERIGLIGSRLPVRAVLPGERIRLPFIPDPPREPPPKGPKPDDFVFRYEARASGSGGTIATARTTVAGDPNSQPQPIKFPVFPDVGPVPASIGIGEPLPRVTTPGVVEHILAPASGVGTTLRIVSTRYVESLPDTLPFGAPRPSGAYRWTARTFPAIERIDAFGGPGIRRFVPHATTLTRDVELR